LTVQVHSLLRFYPACAVRGDTELPGWVSEQLQRVPWVVVRRARGRNGLVPVGVRGRTRAERFAGWLPTDSVFACVTPLQLAARRDWLRYPRRAQIAPLAALDQVEALMARSSLAARWGPAGSVAFELATGCATATPASDVDLVLQLDAPLNIAAAAALHGELLQLSVRVDVLLETPRGAVALGEYARGRAPFVVRTPDGPRLLDDPWAGAVAAA